ncbi:hypothetical protein [Ignicoccus islandicus]|uniref:hypothetical protein n=1 Tax=Ignicoccus islandicus TaxID=54259 RepID=UPI0012EDED54|nr:hypothetical protein [Ignicoccus islandicus]
MSLSPKLWTPKRFKEVIAAAQGKLSNVKGFLQFYLDLIAGAPSPNEEPIPLSELVGGITHVDKLGERYATLKNFGITDLLYYLRLPQSFHVLEIIELDEIPNRLNEIAVRRTYVSQSVYEALKDSPEAALLFSFYAGLMLPTPARHTMIAVTRAASLSEVALMEKFRRANPYNLLLARQVLNRTPAIEGVEGRPWYEPISDLSLILTYLGILQVVKIRPSPDKLAGIRNLSKIRKQIIQMLDDFGDYVLPRGTLLLELEYLIFNRTKDEYWDFDFSDYVGNAKDISWFKSKVSSRAYIALEKFYNLMVEKKDELTEVSKSYFEELGYLPKA